MFRKIDDFQALWKYETECTERVIGALTDDAATRKVTIDGRSIGFLAWHLVLTAREMLGLVGLNIDAPSDDVECPDSVTEIAANYKKAATSVADSVAADWTDDTLLIKDEMYGEVWTRGTTLLNLILHQTHHRGQMTVLMRQAGLVVPGIYGPAKEEWATMGLPAMK